MSIEASTNANIGSQVPSQTVDAQATVQDKNRDAIQPVKAVNPAEITEKIERSINKLNDLMAKGQRSLNFSVDRSSDQVVVRVVDTNTDEIIRQIPNEESIRLAEYIDGMVGVIFNRNA